MAEESSTGSSLESKVDKLYQKVERESRFTRSLVVICTAAIMGVSVVPIKIMLTDLPTILWNEFDGKLDTMQKHWNILQRTNSGEGTAPAAPAGGTTGSDTK